MLLFGTARCWQKWPNWTYRIALTTGWLTFSMDIHITKYDEQPSTLKFKKDISVQGSAIGPASYGSSAIPESLTAVSRSY